MPGRRGITSKAARATTAKPPSVIVGGGSEARRQLGDVYQYASQHGQPSKNEGFYRVEGLELPNLIEQKQGRVGDVDIGQTTGEEFLKQGYGEEGWEKIADALLRAGGRTENYMGLQDGVNFDGDPLVRPIYGQGRVDLLQQPVHTIVGRGIPHEGAASPSSGTVFMNPSWVKQFLPGTPLRTVLDHEMGHIMNPVNPYLAGFPSSDLKSHTERFDRALGNALFDGPGVSHEGLESAIGRTPYFSSYDELAANISAAKRGYYGLTGRIPITEGDYDEMYEFMRDDMQHPINTGHDIQTYNNSFRADPRMEYGPRAGKRAHGWNPLRYQFDQTIEDMTPDQFQRLLNFSTHIADNNGGTRGGAA